MSERLRRLYLISYGYTYGTRLQRPRALVYRLATEHFIVLYVTYLAMHGAKFEWLAVGSTLWLGILGYVVLNGLYEGGYFVNDAVSAKFEPRPTVRAADSHEHLWEFLLSCATWWGMGCLLLVRWGIPFSRLAAASATLALVYTIHNYLPAGRLARLGSFSTLRILRYAFVPFLLAPSSVLPVLLVMLPVLALGIARYAVNKISGGHAPSIMPFMTGVVSYSVVLMVFLPLQAVLLWPEGLPLLLPNALIAVTGMLGFLRIQRGETASPPLRDSLASRG